MNKVIDTNFRGLLMCTRKAYQLISKSNDYGLIININSVAGHLIPSVPFSMNVYCSTKHAITALTESIRQELFRAGNKKTRIAVSLVFLGSFSNDVFQKLNFLNSLSL